MKNAQNEPAVLGPVQRQVRPGAEAPPLVERLRSRDWADRHHRKYREEAADEIERLWHALDLVRQHPEFDEGGPMVEMMDQVLAGEPAPMLEALYDIHRRYGA